MVKRVAWLRGWIEDWALEEVGWLWVDRKSLEGTEKYCRVVLTRGPYTSGHLDK